VTAAGDDLANRDVVVAELEILRAIIRDEPADAVDAARTAYTSARQRLDRPSSVDELTAGFGLTPFERSVLLLAAGPDLIAAVAEDLSARGAGPRLTFGAALALLPDAHWSAITPAAPLRRWELVNLLNPASPTHSPLAVDERVLHHLAGAGHLDARLAASARRLPDTVGTIGALASAADQVRAAWEQRRPAVLSGPQPANLRAAANDAARLAGLAGMLLPAAELPADVAEREAMLRRMERETVLAGAAWVVEAGDGPEELGTALRALVRLDAPVALVCRTIDVELPPEAVSIRVGRLGPADRRAAFTAGFAAAGRQLTDEELAVVAGVFDLPVAEIEQVARDVEAGAELWPACRARAGVTVGTLAQIVTPRAGWADLVLPGRQLEQLRALVSAVRHRTRVLHDWGFADRTLRGLGSTALFAGPSGTGKTLAAEVIAHELDLDLVIVDLSQVVSKYIGETEKHLRRVFDAAEDGGCVLLFDEADTLFGKRSEVRDSHDRYANLEVGYLLQRMESFRGLAILTTNARDALDQAFIRRLRTIVTFPYPDTELRRELWEKAFPAATPVADLDTRQLAGLDVPGGGIASIALTAAYLAAETDGPVGPGSVHTAARWELAKSGRPERIPPGGGARNGAARIRP
jgi:hypothetical protein